MTRRDAQLLDAAGPASRLSSPSVFLSRSCSKWNMDPERVAMRFIQMVIPV